MDIYSVCVGVIKNKILSEFILIYLDLTKVISKSGKSARILNNPKIFIIGATLMHRHESGKVIILYKQHKAVTYMNN